MLNATWITMKNPRCSIWKHKAYSEKRKKRYARKYISMHGSYLFKKAFFIGKKVTSASLSVCGLGFYEASVNGQNPDKTRVLTPVLSDYFRLCRYDTYDVTSLLKDGENTLIIEVCDGWFAPDLKYWGWQHTYHGDSRLIALLTLTYEDGTTEAVPSDETWQWAEGTIISSNIYDGETVDFNRIPKDEDWHFAIPAEAPTDNLQPSLAPPTRICRTLQPICVTRLSDTEYLYDFGENGSKMTCVRAKGKQGDTLILRHAENIHEDGTPDYETLLRAMATDTYTLSDEVCICQPRFTWHGYRYLTVTVSDPSVSILSVEANVIHSDVAQIGTFTCDNEKLNQFHDTCIRSELACLIGVPIDCTQRDERKAWLGDVHVTSELCLYNFDMQSLYRSLLEDIRLDCEANGHAPFICPGDYNRTTLIGGYTTSLDWSVAYPIILFEYTTRYHDIPFVKDHLPALQMHIRHYKKQLKKGFVPNGWFGDWCSVDLPDDMKRVAFSAGPEEHRQNPPFLSTVFYCKTLRLTAELARLCGETALAEEAETLWEICKDALYRRCYHKDTGKYGSGGQLLSALALSEHLVNKEDEPAVFAELVNSVVAADYHPLVGIIGMRILFDVLTEYGKPDVAYRVLTAEGFPGLFDMMGHGRTTFTESQDGKGSGCHCMFGSPDAQLYKLLGGITVDRTKSAPVTIKPYYAPGLGCVTCTQTLPEGNVSVAWLRENGNIRLTVTVPPMLTASLVYPDGVVKTVSGETVVETLSDAE